MGSSHTVTYLPSDGVWVYDCVGVEFVVVGGANGPDSIRFEMAQQVASQIDAFVTQANDYLSAFVNPERFESCGPWMLESVEFGRRPTDSVDDFEMFLVLDGDTYGLWSVRFGFVGSILNRHVPQQFSRREW